MSKLNNDPLIKKVHAEIKEYLQTEENMLSFYATVLACGYQVGGFLIQKVPIGEMPREIQYLLAMLHCQYAAVFAKDIRKAKFDVDFQDYFESGSLDDRFAMVVKQLYEVCKNEKLL